MTIALSDLTIKSATYLLTRSDWEYLITVNMEGVTVVRADPTLATGQLPLLQTYATDGVSQGSFVHITEVDSIHIFPDLESALNIIETIG